MAKNFPRALDAVAVNNDAPVALDTPPINAAPAAMPENTPVPGGGSWEWDYHFACWVATSTPSTGQAPATPLNQPE